MVIWGWGLRVIGKWGGWVGSKRFGAKSKGMRRDAEKEWGGRLWAFGRAKWALIGLPRKFRTIKIKIPSPPSTSFAARTPGLAFAARFLPFLRKHHPAPSVAMPYMPYVRNTCRGMARGPCIRSAFPLS